jgi:hypothetical protein
MIQGGMRVGCGETARLQKETDMGHEVTEVNVFGVPSGPSVDEIEAALS